MRYRKFGRTGLFVSSVTSVIIGAKRIEQLDDNIAATAIKLTGDELAALDKTSKLPAAYPGWMFGFQGEARRKQLAESGGAWPSRPPLGGCTAVTAGGRSAVTN